MIATETEKMKRGLDDIENNPSGTSDNIGEVVIQNLIADWENFDNFLKASVVKKWHDENFQ